MKNYKIVLSVFSFIFSIYVSPSVLAQESQTTIQNTCASSTGYNPAPGAQNPAATVTAYNSCVTQATNQHTNQGTEAPANPGAWNASVACQGLNPTQCQQAYQAWQAQVQAYNEWVNSQNQNPSQTGNGTASATETFEDITAKLNESARKMQNKSTILTTLGMTIIAAGIALMATLIGKPKGIAMVAAGAVLLIYGLVTKNKASDLQAKASQTCEQYNKIATKPLQCANARQLATGDGTITIATNTDGNGVPTFIDPVTGLCRPGAPVECTTLTKDLPPGCFKKGGACLAGGKVPPITVKDGKLTMDLNGKKRTFGIEDLQSEASMVKAGFTPAQAKQFFAHQNHPNSILAQNGLDAKGELKKASGGGVTSAVLSGDGGGLASGSSGAGADPSKLLKDEYAPAAEERTPASAEGLVKDYHGETIGVDRDDIFKMINRRYILKGHQKIFIEE